MSMNCAGRGRAGRWAVPAVAVAGGVGYLVAGLLGGNTGFGVFGLVLMLAVATAFVALSRRSETFAALRDRSDERINAHDVTATAFAGGVLLVVVLALFLVELARGHDGSPYYELAAVGGVSYAAAMAYLRHRR